MKKTIFVLILMLSTLFVFGCSSKQPPVIKYDAPNCTAMGYVTVSDANKCVQVANILINITNKCFELTNQTPLPPMGPYT